MAQSSSTNNFTGGIDATDGVYVNGTQVIDGGGDILTGISAADISLTSAQILVGNGSNIAAGVAMSGDIGIDNAGATTIQTGAVENSMLAASSVTNDKVGDSAGINELTLPKLAVVVYDFAVDGGAQGAIPLTGSVTIPDNAICWVESYDVETTFTSSSDAATITLGFPTDGDLFTGIAISDATNPWDQGVFINPLGGLVANTPKKLTGARTFQVTVAGGENVTAGKVIFYVRYSVSS